MRRVIGPRRSWPPPPEQPGGRNGEPAEMDPIGCFLVIMVVVLVVLTIILVIGALFPFDRVYSYPLSRTRGVASL
jgi:hypothetical protein